MENDKSHEENNYEKVGGVRLISGETDYIRIIFRIKGHFVMIKESTHQEDLTIINVYVLIT